MVQARVDCHGGLGEDADDAHLAPRVRSRIDLDDGAGGCVDDDGEDDGLADGGEWPRERDLRALRCGEGGNRERQDKRAEDGEALHATARARRRKNARSVRT